MFVTGIKIVKDEQAIYPRKRRRYEKKDKNLDNCDFKREAPGKRNISWLKRRRYIFRIAMLVIMSANTGEI